MIKSILVALFLLLSTASYSQSYKTQTYIPWSKSNAGYWSNYSGYNIYSDFDWMVSRSISPDVYGYYYYDIWLYSQSYYWDGYNATYTSTNIKYITVSIKTDGLLYIMSYDNSDIGITFSQIFNAPTLRFKSRSTNPYFYLKWNKMVAK